MNGDHRLSLADFINALIKEETWYTIALYLRGFLALCLLGGVVILTIFQCYYFLISAKWESYSSWKVMKFFASPENGIIDWMQTSLPGMAIILDYLPIHVVLSIIALCLFFYEETKFFLGFIGSVTLLAIWGWLIIN
jgi:hypothetical protein